MLHDNQSIEVWSLATATKLQHIDLAIPKGFYVNDVAVAPDQKTVAVVYHTGDIQLWSLETLTLVQTIRLSDQDDYLQAAQWSPDGCLLATAAGPTGDQREDIIRFSPFMTDIVLWDTRTWKPIRYLKGHADQATDMDWSSDSQQLLAVDSDGKAIIHDVEHTPCQ